MSLIGPDKKNSKTGWLVTASVILVAMIGAAVCLGIRFLNKRADVSPSDIAPEPVAVSLSDTSVEVGKRLSYQLSASGGKNIVFRSSDEAVATVDETGLVKGVATGECTVTAENEDGSRADCRVTVKKVCYLSIDDGPTDSTESILAVLKEYDVKATFFVVGSRNSYLHLTKNMEEQGCVVGLHSDAHVFKTCYATNSSFFRGIELLADSVNQYIEKPCTLLRFPGGTNTSRCKPLWMRRNLNGAADLGYRVFDWTATSADTSPKASANYSFKSVKKTCTEDEEIILMHDRWFNVEALKKIIPYLREKGYIFATLNLYPDESYHFMPRYSKDHKDQPAKSVRITHKNYPIYQGGQGYLTAVMNPENSTDFVRWESADPSIASVDATGCVRALKKGETDIYAITSSGQRGSCHVTVL